MMGSSSVENDNLSAMVESDAVPVVSGSLQDFLLYCYRLVRRRLEEVPNAADFDDNVKAMTAADNAVQAILDHLPDGFSSPEQLLTTLGTTKFGLMEFVIQSARAEAWASEVQ